MRVKYPIEYELNPTEIEKGNHWITLKIKNIGKATLKKVDIRLHSLDTYCISVYGQGHYISDLKPDEDREAAFRVNSHGSANVYVTLFAVKDGDYFWWESGWTRIKVIEERAELERLLVLSHPYTTIGSTLEVEATVEGLEKINGLRLEFWAETPSMNFEELAEIETKELSAGEEAQYSVEFTPKETGLYTLNAYLYDGWKRIGHKTHTIFAEKK